MKLLKDLASPDTLEQTRNDVQQLVPLVEEQVLESWLNCWLLAEWEVVRHRLITTESPTSLKVGICVCVRPGRSTAPSAGVPPGVPSSGA